MTTSTTNPAEIIAARLDARQTGQGQWSARCPAHEDRHASLSIGTGVDGRALLTCHVGCTAAEIAAALDLTLADLFPASLSQTTQPQTYRYDGIDATSGVRVGVHVRREAWSVNGVRAPQKKQMWWEPRGVKAATLALHNAGALRDHHRIAIVLEGERKTDLLNAAIARACVEQEMVAVGTMTGAAGTPCDAALRPLLGCAEVWVWADNDTPGRAHMRRIQARLAALAAARGGDGDTVRTVCKWIAWPDAEAGGDVSDYLVGGGTVEGIRHLVTSDGGAAPEAAPDGAPEPATEPLDPAVPMGAAVEPFPLDTLPTELQAFVHTVAAAIHCPADYVAMPLLVAASAAIGTSACLEIKRGWREYARFWLAIVGDPGDKKSPALAAVHRVIEERQRTHHAAWEAVHAIWRQQDKAGDEPQLRQLYTSDTTIEALGDLLHASPRGVLVTRDELSGWALAMNEYKRRGADRQHWLALWSGAALMVNRRSRRLPLYVERPFVSVVGGIQPDVLSELCDERGRNDGFVHRLLFVYPDRTRRAWTDAEIADEAYGPLRTLFDALYARGGEHDLPLVVRFSSRARDLWRVIANDLYAEAEALDFPDALRGPWAKLEAYTVRLALVLHLARAAFDASVRDAECDEKSLGAAADIGDYLKSHLRRVYARLIARPEEVRLLRLIAWIREHGGACSARDLYRAGVAGIITADAAESALADIVSRGWGRTVLTPNAHGAPTLRLTLYDPTQDNMTGGTA